MSKTPTLRARVWNLLRTARDNGRTGVALAALVTIFNAHPQHVMAAVQSDAFDTPAGQTDPPIYCRPCSEGIVLTPRYFPGEGGS